MPGSQKKQQAENYNNGSTPNKLDDQMEMVLQLITKRTKGENTNAQIESAVSDILQSMGAAPPSKVPKKGNQGKNSAEKAMEDSSVQSKAKSPKKAIEVDMDDYDDVDVKPHAISLPPPSEENSGHDDTPNSDSDWNEEEYKDKISLIPMGMEGAKMMTTFGDSRSPDPKALEEALLGTRRTLQLAMMDARAIRRKIKKRFDEAKRMNRRLDQSSLAQASSLDPTMMSRSLTAHDRLAYNLPCGFDIEQLESLYPEVMREYRRWNDMYQRSQRKNASAEKEDDATNRESDDENDGKKGDPSPDAQTETVEEDDTEALGGHLKERAAHFDTRTDSMQSEGYLRFSQVRQGSFLSRGKRQRKSKEDIEWEKRHNIKGKRGRKTDWEKMDARTIRFLHWLGFDPTTPMKPPDDATTQALAFLGYDTMGRIVEKAIYLKNLDSSRNPNGKESNSTDLEMWELKTGETLVQEDVTRALKDPEIQPTAMYSLDGLSVPSLQRYFGPGFEERLELELEELAAADEGKSEAAEEDVQFRKEEAALFANMSSPPSLLTDVGALVDGQEETIDNKDEARDATKRERKRPRKA
ncbi:unnamed protein product [Cylindrotheca closterium]|uniref:Uncharacterized protein n=1 Tax=Cylindrotheca closterium TaxID=2856 RepID=A0AAD2FET9_9STRA|nr:unnamed protein product [Cylindrotheca closterium]